MGDGLLFRDVGLVKAVPTFSGCVILLAANLADNRLIVVLYFWALW
jgi:hypothetical protein